MANTELELQFLAPFEYRTVRAKFFITLFPKCFSWKSLKFNFLIIEFLDSLSLIIDIKFNYDRMKRNIKFGNEA